MLFFTLVHLMGLLLGLSMVYFCRAGRNNVVIGYGGCHRCDGGDLLERFGWRMCFVGCDFTLSFHGVIGMVSLD